VIAAAFAVNLMWLPRFKTAELRLGFWLWLGSMGVLAAIAIARSRRGSERRVVGSLGSGP
jgi:predicted membrane channel-forming protein YqfA (hemolysin III family)